MTVERSVTYTIRAAEAVTERAELGKRNADRRAAQAEAEAAALRRQLAAQKTDHAQVRPYLQN